MSTEQEIEIQEQDDLEQEEIEHEEITDESQDEEEQGIEESEEEESSEEDEVIISIEGEESNKEEEEQAKAPSWVKDLRKKTREQARRIKELEGQIQQKEQPQKTELPEKPTLEGCDFDDKQFESELEQWYAKKRAYDIEQEKAREAQENAQKAWNAKLEGYTEQRSSLKVNDFEDAEMIAQDALTPAQYAIIINGAENPAKVVYAIGKDPRRAKEFGEMTDLVQFAFKVSKLEDKITVKSRKAPPPERTVSGSGPKSGTVDSTLERLRAEAEKTGDISKVVAYKRQLRNKA